MALYLRTAKERLNSNTQSFLYKWTHIPTQKWYVGSRAESPSFKGFYISPNNEKFASAYDAAKNFDCSASTIRKWSKNMMNGWSFQPKGNN